jgi:formylglycine-generating enzyme
LIIEIYRSASENVGHAIQEAYEKKYLDGMFLEAFYPHPSLLALDVSVQGLFITKMCEMVEITRGDDSFGMMKYQVTQGVWESVIGDNPSQNKGVSLPVEKVSWLDCILFANQMSERENLETYYQVPANLQIGMSYKSDEQVHSFTDQVRKNTGANGYRFPTESEWEYAAKGGEDFIYAGSDDLDEVAWYSQNSQKQSHVVGLKKPNGFGLYDMSGNVFEFCWDFWNPDARSRVLRGGSSNYSAFFSAVQNRTWCSPSKRRKTAGVRFVRNIQTKKM